LVIALVRNKADLVSKKKIETEVCVTIFFLFPVSVVRFSKALDGKYQFYLTVHYVYRKVELMLKKMVCSSWKLLPKLLRM